MKRSARAAMQLCLALITESAQFARLPSVVSGLTESWAFRLHLALTSAILLVCIVMHEAFIQVFVQAGRCLASWHKRVQNFKVQCGPYGWLKRGLRNSVQCIKAFMQALTGAQFSLLKEHARHILIYFVKRQTSHVFAMISKGRSV